MKINIYILNIIAVFVFGLIDAKSTMFPELCLHDKCRARFLELEKENKSLEEIYAAFQSMNECNKCKACRNGTGGDCPQACIDSIMMACNGSVTQCNSKVLQNVLTQPECADCNISQKSIECIG